MNKLTQDLNCVTKFLARVWISISGFKEKD